MNKGYIQKFRKSNYLKSTSFGLVLLLLFNLFYPTTSYALTSGPSQEEFTSFQQASTNDMVDLYSGDFNYNIPLMSVPGPNGGYPLNLSYKSGVTMEQEASWVGLGWNVNVGAINRQLRGLPDDFNGDETVHTMHIKPSFTLSYEIPYQFSFNEKPTAITDTKKFSLPDYKKSSNSFEQLKKFVLTPYYSSISGIGARAVTQYRCGNQYNSVDLGLSFDTQGGIDMNTSFSCGYKYADIGGSVSLKTNEGIAGFNLSSGINLRKTKNNGATLNTTGSNSKTSLSFGVNQNVPEVQLPVHTSIFPFTIEIGKVANFGDFEADSWGIIKGNLNVSKIANSGIVKSKSYGYMNTVRSTSSTDLKDVSRTGIRYSKHVPNLAPSTMNFDLFSYSGQGTGGTFRPYQSSILTVGDRTQVSTTDVYEMLGLIGITEKPKAGLPSTQFGIHLGLGFSKVSGKTITGIWNSGAIGIKSDSNPQDYEVSYFREDTDMSGNLSNDDEYELWKKKKAYRLGLFVSGTNWVSQKYEAGTNLVNYMDTDSNTNWELKSSNISRTTRKSRVNHIKTLTKLESQNYGFTRFLDFDKIYSKTGSKKNEFAKDHHITEMIITHADGMKYIYAMSAYNVTQKDVISSVAYQNKISLNNVNLKSKDYLNETTDEYLSSKSLPSYAHTWMLSYVVSSDYVDVNNNGPDASDYGYWVKFDYTRKNDQFKWRSPYQGASFIEGNLSDKKDDKACYSYGTKEVYYLEKITTKSHIALFRTSERADGRGALEEFSEKSGRVGDDKLYKLDGIDLYTMTEYNSNSVNKQPIKRVIFDYDYSLCGGTPNNSGEVSKNPNDPSVLNTNTSKGKLTLKQVYFTYQNSVRGALTPYKFSYAENKSYSEENIDRWGNYKTINSDQNNYPHSRFPYTNQESQISNEGDKKSSEVVAAWTLNHIDLPSGGSLKIDYESDDYAYVEDKKATHMYDVISVDGINFYDRNNASSSVNLTNSNRLYFKLEEKIDNQLLKLPSTSALSQPIVNNYFYTNYVKGLDKIWCKSLLSLRNRTDQNDEDYFDYVSGYVSLSEDVTKHGVIKDASGNYTIGYISLESVPLNPKIGFEKIHPLSKQAIQFLQTERNELVHNKEVNVVDKPIFEQINTLVSNIVEIFPTIQQVFNGFNRFAYNSLGTGSKIKLGGNTIIRLKDGDGVKYGGDVRVKRITLTDNWINRNSTDKSSYGQEYDYTIEEDGRIISSGVAYEPSCGAEESALRSPVDYSESALLGTSKSFFVENPILENYYPGASVGYRKVVVKSIAPTEASNDNTTNKLFSSAAPITIYEYYTPKDFPVQTSQTDLSSESTLHKPILIPLVYSMYNKRLARSQGYSVVLNDMAGKLKSVSTYTRPFDEINRTSTKISSKRYIYQTETPYSETSRNMLSNLSNVYVESPTEGIKQTQAYLGQTVEIFIDQNQNIESTRTRGAEVDLDYSYPVSIWVMPTPNLSETEFSQSFSVTMKIIHQKGILKEVIETTENSIIKTENLVFDLYTGDVLLSKVTNEYEDPIYTMSFPGHWYYKDGLGAVYEKDNLITSSAPTSPLSMQDGVVTGFDFNTLSENYFSLGDEVYVTTPSTDFIGHVIGRDVNSIIISSPEGELNTLPTLNSIRIINPGRKNVLSSIVGNILFKEYTLNSNLTPQFDAILSASAITLNDIWKISCSSCDNPTNLQTINPYSVGSRGRYKPFQNYSYVTDRKYQKNIRKDGAFAHFSVFPWRDYAISKPQAWVLTNQHVLYSKLGNQLESKNALGIYTSTLYGYNQSLATSTATNSKYTEVGFDSFEDYTTLSSIPIKRNDKITTTTPITYQINPNCIPHFGFQDYKQKISSEASHTGKKSIKLEPGSKVRMRKTLQQCSSPSKSIYEAADAINSGNTGVEIPTRQN